MSDALATRISEGIRNGDAACIAQFIENRRNDLLVLIRSKMGPRLRSKVEVEDVYQELCKTAVASFHKVEFDDRGPFGWLVELIDRKVIDLKRRFTSQKRDLSKEVGIHQPAAGDQPGLANLLAASITSPSKAFSRKQKEILVLDAIGNLTTEQKSVLNMRFAKGLDTKQIAEKIGKTDGATRVLISRSLARLRNLVGENDRPSGGSGNQNIHKMPS